MKSQIETFLTKVPHVEPPAALRSRIMLAIDREQLKLARRTLAATITTSVASLVALVPAVWFTWTELAASGFYQYISLLQTDWTIALTSWKELSLSLLTSLPLTGITIILAVILALLAATRTAVRTAPLAFHYVAA